LCQLGWQLLRATGEPQYADEIERTVFNQLLAAQDPRNGNICYFTPLVGRKDASSSISCCLSSEPRGISMIPQLAWGTREDGPAVLLYAPGEVTIPVRQGLDVTLQSETRFPADGAVTLTVRPQRAARFPLYLRVPAWATAFTAMVGGTPHAGEPGQFLRIDRNWQSGDIVSIRMDMPVRVVAGGQSYADYVAIVRGPQVLALEASLNPAVQYSHRAAPKSVDPDALAFAEARVPNWGQAYSIAGIVGGRPQTLLLAPFADARNYRVWLVRPDRMTVGQVPLTAFGDESWSRDGTERGSICDERPDTYRNTFTPRTAKLDWYAVELARPVEIARVVYRHGKVFSNGGWFDASEGKPQIQVKRTKTAEWETVATLDSYPNTNATQPPGLRDGEPFSVKLKETVQAVGIRITGRPGRLFSSCAELAGYAK
jgi:hypothetical protein